MGQRNPLHSALAKKDFNGISVQQSAPQMGLLPDSNEAVIVNDGARKCSEYLWKMRGSSHQSSDLVGSGVIPPPLSELWEEEILPV